MGAACILFKRNFTNIPVNDLCMFVFTMSDRRASINDIKLPPDAVKGLSLDVLKAINEQDDASFYEFLQGMDLGDLKKVHQEREVLQERLRELAVANCELEPRFTSAKQELRVKCTESADLKEEYVKNFEELKKIVAKHDPNQMVKEMSKAVKDAENDSETFASKFLKNKEENLSAEDFGEKFVELRKLYWLRKVKAEKMNELVKNSHPKAMPRSPKPGHSPTTPNPAHSLPYPSDKPQQQQPLPGASLPPYHAQARSGMPQPVPAHHPAPGHPFPAAAFTSYQPPGLSRPPPPRPQPYHVRQPYNSYR